TILVYLLVKIAKVQIGRHSSGKIDPVVLLPMQLGGGVKGQKGYQSWMAMLR
ncbi:hypothetical protein NPIL_532711, partial [Nephila pilipes]